MRDYRKYEVRLRAHAFVLRVYREIAPLFPPDEKYGLQSQLKRAAFSILFHIVEGCGRFTDKDFAGFLDMAFAPAQEAEYCLLLGFDLGIVGKEPFIEVK